MIAPGIFPMPPRTMAKSTLADWRNWMIPRNRRHLKSHRSILPHRKNGTHDIGEKFKSYRINPHGFRRIFVFPDILQCPAKPDSWSRKK
jgi:hypothetical protein